MCIFFYMGVFYHPPGDSFTMELHLTILKNHFKIVYLAPLKKIFFSDHTDHLMVSTALLQYPPPYCVLLGPTLPTALDRRQRVWYGRVMWLMSSNMVVTI